jgi:hypothetical protein
MPSADPIAAALRPALGPGCMERGLWEGAGISKAGSLWEAEAAEAEGVELPSPMTAPAPAAPVAPLTEMRAPTSLPLPPEGAASGLPPSPPPSLPTEKAEDPGYWIPE